MALCTQLSTGEAKKVKHTAYLINGMRWLAAFLECEGNVIYNLVTHCYLLSQALSISSICFTYPRPLFLKTLSIISRT